MAQRFGSGYAICMWNEKRIVDLLNTNDKAALRGVLAIYKRQTFAEQRRGCTADLNGVGFSAGDAAKGTRLATRILRYGHLDGWELSEARALALRYRRQLLAIAQAKEAAAASPAPSAPGTEAQQ